MIKLYDIVVAKKALSANVPIGTVGTIVFIYSDPRRAYEVEFTDGKATTLDVLTVEVDDVEPVPASEISKHFPGA